MRIKQKLVPMLLLTLSISFGMGGLARAAQSASSNYSVNEVFFGSGGSLHDCSTNYCAKSAAGETGVGNTASSNYQAQAGFNTDRVPYLEFKVNNTNLDIGTLSSTATTTASATFSVRTYLASGYTVKQTSPGPTNGTYTLNGLATPTSSGFGSEQFGINLVANTSPVSFGANPSQNPDASFSHGQVGSGYGAANLFKYVKDDTIAYSDQSSGETDYTISYIFNVSNVTAGGTYTFHHVLVATSTF